jgi:hypothetical protein
MLVGHESVRGARRHEHGATFAQFELLTFDVE